ncbi:hypothetical protein [Microbulbifer hydrolyticus]|uniref:Uncharacterized protein n=1 Tax=Microbulbifer hydrolyticus TaxID=48074 RepID=A0AA89PEG6_9GAMM|nr:hypothetical protein [Microbulbifer hydrolyticus]MBB5213331.1 hypothetical protein [Microbulbifer hydrolyticus]
MMEIDELNIDCEKHGKGIAATVCCHLISNNGAPLGFIENSSEPGDLQGWCYACEHMFLQEEDKTERFCKFCDFSVVCEECYKNIKAHHESNT